MLEISLLEEGFLDIYTSNSVNYTYTIHTIDGIRDSKDIRILLSKGGKISSSSIFTHNLVI